MDHLKKIKCNKNLYRVSKKFKDIRLNNQLIVVDSSSSADANIFVQGVLEDRISLLNCISEEDRNDVSAMEESGDAVYGPVDGKSAPGISDYLAQREKEKFFEVIQVNNLEMSTEYINRNSELVNCKDERGRAPLHIASANGYTQLVKLLVDNGANIEVYDSVGNKPLQLALIGRHLEIGLYLSLGTSKNAFSPEKAVGLLTKINHILYNVLVKKKKDMHKMNIPKILRVVNMLQESMETYGFTCREMEEIVKMLTEMGFITDGVPVSSIDDDLSDAMTRSLYFE